VTPENEEDKNEPSVGNATMQNIHRSVATAGKSTLTSLAQGIKRQCVGDHEHMFRSGCLPLEPASQAASQNFFSQSKAATQYTAALERVFVIQVSNLLEDSICSIALSFLSFTNFAENSIDFFLKSRKIRLQPP
jgi:hypothetical protein